MSVAHHTTPLPAAAEFLPSFAHSLRTPIVREMAPVGSHGIFPRRHTATPAWRAGNGKEQAVTVNSEQLLKTFPRGPYTTARTHQVCHLWEGEVRAARGMHGAGVVV